MDANKPYKKRTYGKKVFHKDVDSDVRKFEGELKPERVELFKKILAKMEEYKRVNQYV